MPVTAPNALDAKTIYFLDDLSTDEDIAKVTFSIADLAAEFGLSVRAIRLYEEHGLLRPERQGVRRVFRQRDRVTLEQIQRARRFGLDLDEIAGCLIGTAGPFQSPVLQVPADRCRRRIDLLRQERDQIDRTIRDLEGLMRSADI
jgi:DNA-binding transcriptional MerR regulator